jgi:hypothetical protein
MPDMVTYIDYQRFGDGSNRWLWAIYHADRLWRAGVAHAFSDAKAFAHSSWEQLREALPADDAARLVNASDLEAFDHRRLAAAGQPDIVPPA